MLSGVGIRPYGLQQKFLFAFLALVLGLVLAVSLVVEHRQRSSIIRQMKKRGTTIATYLAAVSAKSLLTYNFIVLEQDVEKISADSDVLYAIIHHRDNRVAAYSAHDEKLGMLLKDAISQRSVQVQDTLIQNVLGDDGKSTHYDIAVPVFIKGDKEKWGTVRIGLSLHDMYEEIHQTRWQVFLLGLLGVLTGSLVAIFLARRIAAPLHALTEGTMAVARGDLDYMIPVRSRDEIAVLASNFNHMTVELTKHRRALEQTNDQLDQKVQELSRLANYNQNVLTSMTSGLITLDLDGCVEIFNATAATITGLQFAAVQGASFRKLFANNAQFVQVLEASRQHCTSLTTPRLDFCRRDGSHIPLSLRTAMLQDHAANIVGLLAIFEDLSPLQLLEQRVQRADRLASLGQMAAGIAHEVKNPLASIHTFVQLVSRRHQDAGFMERFDRIVPREINRINLIVEEMLELARPTRLQSERTKIVAVLQRVTEVYSERMQQQHIELKTDFSTSLPELMADAEQLYRGFANITLNAIEAMASGGELSITCRPTPRALVDFAAPGLQQTHHSVPADTVPPIDLFTSDVEIIFVDTGQGIPPEQLDLVFTPFHTTKPKGTGLGLAITHKIIEEHRGSMQIASQVGHGTTVTIRLPTSPQPLPSAPQGP
ncbi:MAG: ATP-binding protein [bacterium]|nr:ATP-binding protein [bacterium]